MTVRVLLFARAAELAGQREAAVDLPPPHRTVRDLREKMGQVWPRLAPFLPRCAVALDGELVGDDDGIFGCMSLLACHDVCPKELPLESQIAFLRRRMMRMGFK